MDKVNSSMIAIRVSPRERDNFRLLAELEQKPLSQVVKLLVERELRTRKLSASDIRKLPKELRAAILKRMTDEALPVYSKYKEELEIEETGDGIE